MSATEPNRKEEKQRQMPPIEKVYAFFVYGDNKLFSDQCGISMSENLEMPDTYIVELIMRPSATLLRRGVNAKLFANRILRMLNMPNLDQLDKNNDVTEQLSDIELWHRGECEVVFPASRGEFEEYVERISQSRYVRESEKPDVGYVLGEAQDEDQRELLKAVYIWRHPYETREGLPGGLVIRPVIDYKGDTCGYTVDEPFELFMFRDIPYVEPDRRHEQKTFWQGWE